MMMLAVIFDDDVPANVVLLELRDSCCSARLSQCWISGGPVLARTISGEDRPLEVHSRSPKSEATSVGASVYHGYQLLERLKLTKRIARKKQMDSTLFGQFKGQRAIHSRDS